MIFFKFLAILASFGVAFAANQEEKEILVKFQPITAEQYESLIKISAGKPVISEGRLISSAVTGITGLATGFQVGKLLPNLFGGSNENDSKGTVGGYPLCTINANDATARQLDGSSYINMEELTEALARPGLNTKGLPVINCVLVLDDGKGHTEHTTHRPTHRPPRPTSTSTTTTTAPTTSKPRPPHPPHHPWYPTYPSYPYPPPPHYHPYPHPPYPQHPYPQPPPYYYYPYIKYPVYENDEEYEKPTESPVQLPTINIHSFLLDKLQALHETPTTTTTTRRPTKRPTRRPPHRPRPEYPPREYKSQRQVYNDDLDEYDDSIDYIEVSKKAHH